MKATQTKLTRLGIAVCASASLCVPAAHNLAADSPPQL
jgi:hypothetical protein